MRSFASDNNSEAHPAILEAVARENRGDAKPYGEDETSARADKTLEREFGVPARTFFVTTGTAANVMALKSVCASYNSVICADTAHINNDECGAPEAMGGYKLVTVPQKDGKIRPEDIKPQLHGKGFVHHSQPSAVQITQCTELGTVYAPEEIRAIADLAHENGLYLHMDGARLANAAAHLGVGLKEITTDAGVDMLSFGGAKNGLLLGEAVIFLNPDIGHDFKYLRKQGMQLTSKMRFISAQFERYLQDGLWLENARKANRLAALLAEKAAQVKGVTITRPVQSNAVFANIPEQAVDRMLEKYYFYVWNEESMELRWMTSFKTTEREVDEFVACLEESV